MRYSIKPMIFAVIGLFLSALASWAQLVIANLGEPIQSSAHPLNLVVTNKLNCIELKQVKNSYTPSDLAGAVTKCIGKGRYDDAIQLFFVYSTYGRYDQLRITDRSAGAAMGMLNNQIGLELMWGRLSEFQKSLDQLQDRDGAFFKNTCLLIKQLGPPSYTPMYMLAHGSKSMEFEGDNVRYLSERELLLNLKNISVGQTWREALHNINGCPE